MVWLACSSLSWSTVSSGFIGPEYLYDERQIIRAGLEDHFMGKLLGLPMGCDVCYTNHAAADQNSADNLMVLLTAAGCNYFMGVPCADDVMLNYQSTSFHDALAMRRLFGLRPAPEFLSWLKDLGIYREDDPTFLDPNARRQLVDGFQSAIGDLQWLKTTTNSPPPGRISCARFRLAPRRGFLWVEAAPRTGRPLNCNSAPITPLQWTRFAPNSIWSVIWDPI